MDNGRFALLISLGKKCLLSKMLTIISGYSLNLVTAKYITLAKKILMDLLSINTNCAVACDLQMKKPS